MRTTEFRRCKCGYNLLVYVIKRATALNYIFIDGHSGNYEQVDTCPGCHDVLYYNTLEG